MSDLVGNPKDQFSHVTAHPIKAILFAHLLTKVETTYLFPSLKNVVTLCMLDNYACFFFQDNLSRIHII